MDKISELEKERQDILLRIYTLDTETQNRKIAMDLKEKGATLEEIRSIKEEIINSTPNYEVKNLLK